MDITTSFIVLYCQDKPLSFDTPVPAFTALSLLMDMEREGILHLSENGRFILSPAPIPHPYKPLADIIRADSIGTVKELIDRLLRNFSYNELEEIVTEAIRELCKYNSFIAFSKGKLLISDELYNKTYIDFVSNLINSADVPQTIATASLLYGCRLLSKRLDKAEYRSVASLITEGVSFDDLPLTSYIVSSIDRIRGHIMGIVAN